MSAPSNNEHPANVIDLSARRVPTPATEPVLTGQVLALPTTPVDPEPQTVPAPEVAYAGDDVLVDQQGHTPDALTPYKPAKVPTTFAQQSATVWANTKHSARLGLRTLAFHALRAPFYLLRIWACAPTGLWRVGGKIAATVFDRASKPLRAQAADAKDAETFMRLRQDHNRRVTVNLFLVATLATVAITALPAVAKAWPWSPWVATAAALTGLGLAGRKKNSTVIASTLTVTDHEVPRLTPDLVLTALGALGISELNKSLRAKGYEGVGFPSPICREGKGWRCEVDLPAGVTAGDVMERREQMASGLRRPTSCVWLETDPDVHTGRLIIWVADRPLSQAGAVTWPLAKAGKVNLFNPFPLGQDPQGRTVNVTLAYASGVIGAVPRMGKTFALRLLGLAAALDPRCAIYAFDLKGTGDLKPLAQVAHRYRCGDEDEDITYLMGALREAVTDMRARSKVLRALPAELARESKVTDALANQISLSLHPVIVLIDECQMLFEHDTFGTEAERLVTDLVKRGPALGIWVFVATQRPDAKSLPPGIRGNAVLRLCLKVTGQLENDMVLGTSAYRSGTRATMFSRKDLGVGYLAGEGDDPQIVRTAYVDSPTAEAICERARTARLAAGTLSGYAADADNTPDEQQTGIIEHLIGVWPTTDGGSPWPRAQYADLAEPLAAAQPALYSGWGAEEVGAAARAAGLPGVQVKRSGTNRRGLAWADVSASHLTLSEQTGDEATGQTPIRTDDRNN